MSVQSRKRVYIQEVCTRDGFQAEARFVPTQDKVALINQLSQTGLALIEVSSFTSPKAIPMLADAEEVFLRIERRSGVEYSALVPNLKGCERALAANATMLTLVMSASESHSRANLKMSSEQSLSQFASITAAARGKVKINAAVSTVFGCPFEGDVPVDHVLDVITRLVALEIRHITLSDTTGMANPAQVRHLFDAVLERWPAVTFTAHFHDTRAMGLANVVAALDSGVTHFDASLGGLGGCPFAPGATGNICTEDLVHMLECMGYDTGVNLEALLTAARSLPKIVGHDVPGHLIKAGPSSRRYSLSDASRQ